jgi:hypothetical protein
MYISFQICKTLFETSCIILIKEAERRNGRGISHNVIKNRMVTVFISKREKVIGG